MKNFTTREDNMNLKNRHCYDVKFPNGDEVTILTDGPSRRDGEAWIKVPDGTKVTLRQEQKTDG